MQVVVLGICACSVAVSVVCLLRASFYRWRLTTLIQLDRRYYENAVWRREADDALISFREDDFVIKYGIVPAHPQWQRKWKVAFIGGIVAAFLILGVYLLFLASARG